MPHSKLLRRIPQMSYYGYGGLIWHNAKIVDSMRGGTVQSAISELSLSARLVHISLLTVQETVPVLRSVRTAVSMPAENALNAIAVHTR